MSDFGKLILTKPDGLSQEFLLNKSLVTLGRATTNDIVLPGGRVSRNHAHIQYAEDGIILTDLQSANGVWLNGQRIVEARIQAGDRIEISGNILEYVPLAPDTGEEATVINSENELEMTLLQMSVPSSLNDTAQPRLVIHAPDRTWELPLEAGSYTIGRNAGNDLVLDYAKISRNHARIERKRDMFILRDLQSTNGTYFGDERIEQHLLENGDTFRIGPTRVVFKSGFSQEEMTIADGLDLQRGSGLTPVIFVPGYFAIPKIPN
jgi:pSer/pThr/pTyr-binding forkhead associated (FHA) protein